MNRRPSSPQRRGVTDGNLINFAGRLGTTLVYARLSRRELTIRIASISPTSHRSSKTVFYTNHHDGVDSNSGAFANATASLMGRACLR
jgi:hypothetical protein